VVRFSPSHSSKAYFGESSSTPEHTSQPALGIGYDPPLYNLVFVALPLRSHRSYCTLRVLGFGFFQDGYVGVGVLPEVQESQVTAAVPPSAPTRQTVGRNVWDRVRSQSSVP
jgi:hypothetical protein